MKRRKFIQIISGFSLVSIGSYAAFPTFEEVAKKIIKKATSELKVNDDQIDKFIKEAHEEHYWHQFSLLKKEFIKAHYLLEDGIVHIPYSSKYRQYKNKIIGQFLLSTDFFLNKMDTHKKITYLSFYNPYKSSCGSPFSNLYYNNI